MKILLLSRYSRLGASSRLRSYQYLPWLKKHGIHIDVSYLFNDQYLRDLYISDKKSIANVCRSYFNRLIALLKINQYDLIWIEYELFPWLPASIESMLSKLGIPFIVDFDDAIFYRYQFSSSRFARLLLGNKIDKIMRKSKAVLAGNRHILSYAYQAGAKRVELIPTVVDLDRYDVDSFGGYPKNDFIIGWIGSPKTSHYLRIIEKALSFLSSKINLSLVLIGSGPFRLKNVKTTCLHWSENTEIDLIKTFDVGIMPLYDSFWEQGKCGYKIIQYMACAKPAIASPVGVNSEIIQNGMNGYLATNSKEWIDAVLELHASRKTRERIGNAGRQTVEDRYSLSTMSPKVYSILESLLE
jgi:glycosyltransferase involved in cell wall biosynthesis